MCGHNPTNGYYRSLLAYRYWQIVFTGTIMRFVRPSVRQPLRTSLMNLSSWVANPLLLKKLSLGLLIFKHPPI